MRNEIENPDMGKVVQQLQYDLVNQRAKILEDFAKAYLASGLTDLPTISDIVKTIELVEKRTGDEVVWYFRKRSDTNG